MQIISDELVIFGAHNGLFLTGMNIQNNFFMTKMS